MGRVSKKKTASKQEADVEIKEQEIIKKKQASNASKYEAQTDPTEDDEDVSDEDVEDEDEHDGDDQILDFDFEAYPPSDDDRDGIVNMLTQTFLRTDIDLKAMAEEIIAKAPHGVVLTQAYDDDDTEEDYMAYGLSTTIVLNEKKGDAPKFIIDLFAYILSRAKKCSPKEIYKKIEELQQAGDGKTAFFVNERLLNFPSIVVPQVFESIRTDLSGFDTKYKYIIYIQKLRILENDVGVVTNEKAGSSSTTVPPKKKRKIGKAEKKRTMAAALSNSEIEFDNSEDRILFELTEGKEMHFDYPVHMDVEPGSKFHIVEKDRKKWNPFRRLVIMDYIRFDAFLKKVSEGFLV